MIYYYDTSALCRHYHAEPGSDKVESLFSDATARHVISRLTFVECQSAFAVKVRTTAISSDDFALLRRHLRADVNRRSLIVARMLRRLGRPGSAYRLEGWWKGGPAPARTG